MPSAKRLQSQTWVGGPPRHDDTCQEMTWTRRRAPEQIVQIGSDILGESWIYHESHGAFIERSRKVGPKASDNVARERFLRISTSVFLSMIKH